LISIPAWDFNWQGYFTFPTMTKIPQGYTLHGEATYDNTASNPFNPNDPPQWVYFGEETADEMFFVFIDLVLYEEGDEYISLGPADAFCPADLSGDGIVGVADALILLGDFGCQTACSADLNDDQTVTVADVLLLLGLYGSNCD